MTEEDFIKELVRRGRTSETIESILLDTSAQHIRQRATELQGRHISLEEAEGLAKLKRKTLLDSIDVLLAGGAVWDEPSQTFLRRSDFDTD